MTRLISILIILLAIFVGYRLYVYWEKVAQQKDLQEEQVKKQKAEPRSLSGMPLQLEASWAQAAQSGAGAMSNWLSVYGGQVEDPRLAWIQLDYCEKLAWSNPAEAKRVFAAVRDRLRTNSPVYPRLNQLENAFR
jgi:hypothetical protein